MEDQTGAGDPSGTLWVGWLLNEKHGIASAEADGRPERSEGPPGTPPWGWGGFNRRYQTGGMLLVEKHAIGNPLGRRQ